jgi:hypothetical protein
MDWFTVSGQAGRPPHFGDNQDLLACDAVMALAEEGFPDLPFVDLRRAPYVWKKMILVARRPAGGVKRRIKILGLDAFHIELDDLGNPYE